MAKKEECHQGTANTQGSDRGSIDLRTVVGIFLLLVVAGPLASATIDIQSSLASTPAFSWVEATAVAILILVGVGAAVVGLD